MKKVFKKIGIILLSFVILITAFFAIINIIPPKKDIKDNPFISKTGLPMICAHRGGKALNPENTMKAYKACVNEYNVDILETDLWLTKDEKLVLMNDKTIKRTSDAEVILGTSENLEVDNFTLDELRNFNFGYNFKQGLIYPYRDIVSFDDPNRKEIIKDNDLSIVTFDEFLGEFYDSHKDLLFVVEVKNGKEDGFRACEIINETLNNYPEYKGRIVISTFHDEIESHLKENYPDLLRGASMDVATNFVITTLLGVNLFDSNKFACLQIPLTAKKIDLTNKRIINRAHRRNISVQYWTINNEDEMRLLIERKCDAIMTDNPLLLSQILSEYNK